MKTYTLITGATRGLGKSFAYTFAKHGHNLILVARTNELLLEIKSDITKKYNVDVITYDLDLATIDSARNLYELTCKEGLVIDVLVNNAGLGDIGEFINCDIEKNQNIINLNITTLTKLTYYYLQDMKNLKCAYILNVSSIGAFMPGPLISVYYASKAYALSFTEALTEELRDTDIHVMALCPGTLDTNFFSVASPNQKIKHNVKAKDPNTLAKKAYIKLYKKRTVYIYGASSKFIVFAKRILSLKRLRRITYRIQKNRIKK